MVFEIKVKGLRGIERKLKKMGGNVYTAATISALNKTATSARAEGAREIAKRMGGPRIGDIKREMRLIRAQKIGLSALIVAEGSPLGLDSFRVRQLKKGVSHTAYGAKRRVIRGAFIAKSKAKQERGVYVRRGPDRYPIKKLFGPGIARTMGSKEVQDAMFKVIKAKLTPNLQREIRYRLSKL